MAGCSAGVACCSGKQAPFVAGFRARAAGSPCAVCIPPRASRFFSAAPSRKNAIARRSVAISRSRIVAAANGETESSNAVEDIVKGFQEAWEKTDDKPVIGCLGFSTFILLWAATGLVAALDKLPVIPDFFQLVGMIFSVWFVYRYLLFKPDREDLQVKIGELKRRVLGERH